MLILCEGPRCNSGVSARDRERTIMSEMPQQTTELRDEASRYARSTTSRQLRLTEHTQIGTRGGCFIFACHECGHERVYGNREGSFGFATVTEGETIA